mgnify:CR=1 FL=1
MSRGYNRVVLMGNLARDPDVRFTPTKQKVARITVAIGRQWKNKVTGELQSHTDFVPVAVWGPQADVCERYLRKGRPVLVEGRISVRDFDDLKTGQRRLLIYPIPYAGLVHATFPGHFQLFRSHPSFPESIPHTG